jgi:hypothetical protein
MKVAMEFALKVVVTTTIGCPGQYTRRMHSNIQVDTRARDAATAGGYVRAITRRRGVDMRVR